MSQNYIHSLTPLRGIAAIMVVVYHFQVLMMPLINPERSYLINKWYIMVDFFFILSGFIITHVYQKYFAEGFKWAAFKKFMIARFGRLYPLHLATLIGMIGLFLVIKFAGLWETLPHFTQMTLDTNAIIANIFMVQASGIFPEPTWNTPSWSIAVEWWTYALFPFLIFALTRKSKFIKVIAFLFSIGAYLSIMYYFQPAQFAARGEYLGGVNEQLLHSIDVMVGSSILRCVAGFVLGMLVYQAYEKRWGSSLLSHSAWLPMVTVLIMIGWHFNAIPDIVTVIIFSFMILMAIYNNGAVKKVLNTRVLEFLGDISYSIYMVHIPIVVCYYIARGFWKSRSGGDIIIDPGAIAESPIVQSSPSIWIVLGLLAFFTASTIFVAYLTYTYIEKPMRSYFKNKTTQKKTDQKISAAS